MLIVQPFHSGLCCHEHGSSVPKHEILHWGQLMPPVPAGDAWLAGWGGILPIAPTGETIVTFQYIYRD